MTDTASCPGLRVGAAAVAVTPPCGCRMQGYELRHAERIEDPLFVNALAVGGDNIEWLLLTVDCIGVDRFFTSRVRARVAAALAIPLSSITVACSHTHSGPATLPRLGEVEADQSYLAVLERGLEDAAIAAAADRQETRWRFGVASLAENINRRVRRQERVELGANPDGPVDQRLRVIRIDRIADGAPLALIVHYACHATASGGVPHISADWPGAMRATIRSSYADSRPPIVCFLQGCTGDVTHRIARDRDSWPEHFGVHTAVQSRILGRLAAEAALTAAERSVAVEADAIAVRTEPLKLRYHRRIASERTEVQVVRIGGTASRAVHEDSSIWIVALPGEPFTSYSTDLGERLRQHAGAGEHRVLVCGYANDAVGYLPTREALRSGGYEVSRAHGLYQRPAAFAASTERRVYMQAASAVTRLAPSVQRRLR